MESLQPPKRGRGRPKGSTKAKPPCDPSEFENSDIKSAANFKEQLTLKEMNFLQIYFSGRITIEKAMIAAGYKDYNPKWRYVIARKILEKYESQAGDHRKIFREIGAGEVAVVRGLLELAQNARSENVRRQAWADIAACLGLKKEILEPFQGVQVIIRGKEDKPGDQATKPETDKPKVVPITKTLQITK
jgi:hypothetical protein